MPKKSKQQPVEAVEVSSDEEIEDERLAEQEDDDDEEQTNVKSVTSIRNARKKARNSGYRKLALAVGAGVGKKSSSKDMVKYAISASDLARLATWAPETGEGLVSENQLKAQLELKFASLPSGAAAVLHANVEALARNVMNDVVERVKDGTSNTVTAAHMRSALRKMANVLEFDQFQLPAGVVEHARMTEKGFYNGTGADREWVSKGTVLPELDEQEKIALEDKKANVKVLNKVIKGRERVHAMKKEENKKRREEMAAKKRSEAAAEAPVAAAI